MYGLLICKKIGIILKVFLIFLKHMGEKHIPFSDLSASIFTKVLKERKSLNYTKLKTIEANKKIYVNLKEENYIYTSVETPIFTIKSNKYDDLYKKLMQEGINAENCSHFINLDKTYARIRINEDYEQLIRILKKIL